MAITGMFEKLMRSYVRREGRRVFLADGVLKSGIELAAGRTASELDLRVEPRSADYLVRATAKGSRTAVAVVLEELSVAGGELRAAFETPEGVTLEGRPIATRFVTLFTRTLGVKPNLPDGVTWDGIRGSYAAPLDRLHPVGKHLGTLDLQARIQHADGGLWFEFQHDDLTRPFLGVLVKAATSLAGAGGPRI